MICWEEFDLIRPGDMLSYQPLTDELISYTWRVIESRTQLAPVGLWLTLQPLANNQFDPLDVWVTATAVQNGQMDEWAIDLWSESDDGLPL